MRPLALGALTDLAGVIQGLKKIEQASQVDALVIADEFSVQNFTPTRTLNVATATATDIANFLATFIDDCHRRGSRGGG